MWEYTRKIHLSTIVLKEVFSSASLVNITAVSLERAHAAIFPLKHRFIKKWVHGVVIICIWLTTAAEKVRFLLLKDTAGHHIGTVAPVFILLSMTIVSSVSVLVKVRSNRRLRHSTAASAQ